VGERGGGQSLPVWRFNSLSSSFIFADGSNVSLVLFSTAGSTAVLTLCRPLPPFLAVLVTRGSPSSCAPRCCQNCFASQRWLVPRRRFNRMRSRLLRLESLSQVCSERSLQRGETARPSSGGGAGERGRGGGGSGVGGGWGRGVG
jgi:hypothetical protein